MKQFKVRFTPTLLDALGILWAALTRRAVALVVDNPIVQRESDTSLAIHSSHIEG